MQDDGVIKFNCIWEKSAPFSEAMLAELILWRDRCHSLGFIGTYPNGIGYGNISQKQSATAFWISGTQTGYITHTTPQHYTLVDSWDVARNTLHCTGPIAASSESLTHAALYESASDIAAIVHIHHSQLWATYQYQLPTTDPNVPYGTPAMAEEMRRLLRETDLSTVKILVMGGHEDGLLALGATLAEATHRLEQLLG